MNKNEQRARDYFRQGYNCAQCVFLTYSEDFGFDKETALRLSSSFGGGMGRLREVCGAVSMMFLIAGLKNGYTENNNDEIKEKHYAHIQGLANKFRAEYGTIICSELLGVDKNDSPVPSKRTEQYYEERPCEDFIGFACNLIDEYVYGTDG